MIEDFNISIISCSLIIEAFCLYVVITRRIAEEKGGGTAGMERYAADLLNDRKLKEKTKKNKLLFLYCLVLCLCITFHVSCSLALEQCSITGSDSQPSVSGDPNKNFKKNGDPTYFNLNPVFEGEYLSEHSF